MMRDRLPDVATWLATAQSAGKDTPTALRMFDALPVLECEELQGQWRGGGLRTGHALDGVLEAFGWYGKRFDDGADRAFPLLFSTGSGPVAVDPAWIPLRAVLRTRLHQSRAAAAVFRRSVSLLRTARPSARLRMSQYRGRTSATMIYDTLPINDVFRRIDASRVLGLMDCRYFPAPFFFVLTRDAPRPG